MLWVPQKGLLRQQTNLNTAGDATFGTSLTTGAAASTKGSYVDCIATTDFDAYWIIVHAGEYALAATDSNLMVDVAIAASGGTADEIIIADLMFGGCGVVNDPHTRVYQFPLYIPAGSKIAARGAGQRVSTAFNFGVYLFGGDGVPPFRTGNKVTTYGVSTVPNGTTVVPGASGAAGTHTEITASTTYDHFAFQTGFQPGVDTTKMARGYTVVMGIGSSGSEFELPQQNYFINGAEEQWGPFPNMPLFADAPSGSRLTTRISNSGTNDSGNYNCCIYAVS